MSFVVSRKDDEGAGGEEADAAAVAEEAPLLPVAPARLAGGGIFLPVARSIASRAMRSAERRLSLALRAEFGGPRRLAGEPRDRAAWRGVGAAYSCASPSAGA